MSRSPVFSGGMKVLIPVAVLVVLFAGGLAIGSLFFDGADAERADLGLDANGGEGAGASDDQTGTADGVDREQVPGSTTGSNAGAVPGAATQGGSGSDSGPSDAAAAAEAPDRSAEPSPPQAGFLETGFGPQAAPATVAGMRRTSAPVVNGDVLEAEYSGGDAGGFDLLFLTVVKKGSPTAALQQADEFIHAFPISEISFTWGGRQIRQAMTDEGRPNQFPPLICMVWSEGSYAIRVVTAPLAPDQVVAARDSTLEFIGALPY